MKMKSGLSLTARFFLSILILGKYMKYKWLTLLFISFFLLENIIFEIFLYICSEISWNLGADVRPHAYTKDEWFNGPHAMFYYNVEEDKEVLYES